ncbi:hypothetical protein [Glycocaulis alkaliphilus]|nr:hypothetical protein [Glycocaulis alkaliphilus]GGB65338.1 hypothetical protein GCM10007417_01320 [Glycocaulis alkaliphilus]
MHQRLCALAMAVVFPVVMTGCASQQAVSALPAVAEPDGQIFAALDIGLRAEAAGDGAALLAAASLLEASGARPAEGEADLAARWQARAAELGETVPPSRGRIAGPAYRNGIVGAGETALLRDSFHSGRAARVSLQARGSGTLRLSIRRHDGEPVCEALATTAPVSCQWVPVWSEPFTIEVVNLTGAQIPYYLITN